MRRSDYFCTGESAKVEMPKFDATFTGTGDLFAALILARGHEPLQVSHFQLHYHLWSYIVLPISLSECMREGCVHYACSTETNFRLGTRWVCYQPPQAFIIASFVLQICQRGRSLVLNKLNSDLFKARMTLSTLPVSPPSMITNYVIIYSSCKFCRMAIDFEQ